MALHLSIEVFPSFTHIHNYQICVPFFVFFFLGGGSPKATPVTFDSYDERQKHYAGMKRPCFVTSLNVFCI